MDPTSALRNVAEIHDLRMEVDSGDVILSKRLPAAMQDGRAVVYDCVGVKRQLAGLTRLGVIEASTKIDRAIGTLTPAQGEPVTWNRHRAILNADTVEG